MQTGKVDRFGPGILLTFQAICLYATGENGVIDAYRSNISGNLTAGKMVNLSGATVSGNVTAKSIDIHETKTMDAQISGSVTATGGGELNLGSHAMRLDGSCAVLTLEKDTQISSNKPAGKTQIDVRNGASLVSWADVLLDFTRADLGLRYLDPGAREFPKNWEF